MASLEQYQNMFRTLPCGICRVALDEEFTLLYANPFYYHIYGYTPENAQEAGFTTVKFILPAIEFRDIHERVMEHVHNKETLFELEYQGVHSSGKSLWLVVRCTYNTAQPDSIVCVVLNIAAHKQLEDRLRMSIKESQIAFELTDKMMYVFDIAERRLILSEKVANTFGLAQITYDVPESIAASGIIAEDSIDEFNRFYHAMIQGIQEGQAVTRKRRKDGSIGWYFAKYTLIYDHNGKPRRAIISGEDITQQREKELTYQKWSQYFKDQEGKTIGYYEYDMTVDQQMEGVGDAPPEYLKSLKTYTGTVLYIAEHFVCEEDREAFYWFFDRNRLLALFYDQHEYDASIEYRRIGKNGLYWVRASVRMVADPYNNHVKLFLMTRNIDLEKREEIKLHRLVEIDEMTGTLKRETFIRKVTEILSRNDYVVRHALIILDIDHFKEHNDAYGHQFGDQVIRETTALVKRSLRKNDLCGRLGGDEFVVFLSNIASIEAMLPRISDLCNELNRPYPGKGNVSCSLGVSFYPHDGITFEELYQHADTALYDAKESGRAVFKIYNQ
ncbi:diguanylate cyclase [Agathobaculum sp. NTUH-O15-33]|uniref:sensor domain-containing diguanylate cyclase n=1 Tax=Agathobaculum sp. NTUH-O15-33 TaxID=3079302 RepID=UPI002958CBA8|nr:diguanylate cyclase [Agathobaculum sp. NTUH-O15-33]WNX86146.1 diguanylate cyclase [Agathobaculum sp. NTUH-O15-33]